MDRINRDWYCSSPVWEMVSGHPNTKNQSGSATNLRVGVFVSLSSIYSVISLADVHLHYVCNRQWRLFFFFFWIRSSGWWNSGNAYNFFINPSFQVRKRNSKMLKVRAADFSWDKKRWQTITSVTYTPRLFTKATKRTWYNHDCGETHHAALLLI